MYDAAASAQTLETADEAIINPIDFGSIADVNTDKSTGNIKRSRIQGFDEFTLGCSKSVNRANALREIKGRAVRKCILRCGIYCIRKSDRGIKIGWGDYDKIAYRGLGGG